MVGSRDLERAIALAERKGVLSAAELVQRAEASPRHRGARTIRNLLAAEAAPAFTRSEAESRLLHLIRRARLRRPQVNAHLCGYEVDFFWSEERLVAEVDGYAWHGSSAAFTRDRRRDADLHASGFRVIRFTWDDVAKHPEATIGVLAAALARAQRRPAAARLRCSGHRSRTSVDAKVISALSPATRRRTSAPDPVTALARASTRR